MVYFCIVTQEERLIAKFKRLKARVAALDIWDSTSKDDVVRRAIHYTKSAFGPDSSFIEYIKGITFTDIPISTFGAPLGPTYNDIIKWEEGKRNLINIIDLIIEELKERASDKAERDVAEVGPRKYSNKVFIVHGHDEEMKQSVARTISKLGLEPVILHEQPNRGRTIIEKFEEESSDVGFAVVLLSPDDEGRKRGEEVLHPRARQNVVFEHGFFFAKLGRDRVVALYKDEEGFEMPSDNDGIIYVAYDGEGAWRMNLVRELQACGYEVSADDLL